MPALTAETQHRQVTAGREPWRRALTGAAALAVLVLLGVLAAGNLEVTAFDLRLDQNLAAGRGPALTTLALLATTLAQPAVGAAAAVLLPLLLALRRQAGLAVRVGAVIGGSLALALVTKTVIGEARPPAALALVPADSGYGYPSGHAAVAAAVVAALILLSPHGRWRAATVVVGAGFALLVGWSRLYFGVHYLPDILGSYAAVAAASLLVHAAWHHPLRVTLRPALLALTVLLRVMHHSKPTRRRST